MRNFASFLSIFALAFSISNVTSTVSDKVLKCVEKRDHCTKLTFICRSSIFVSESLKSSRLRQMAALAGGTCLRAWKTMKLGPQNRILALAAGWYKSDFRCYSVLCYKIFRKEGIQCGYPMHNWCQDKKFEKRGCPGLIDYYQVDEIPNYLYRRSWQVFNAISDWISMSWW